MPHPCKKHWSTKKRESEAPAELRRNGSAGASPSLNSLSFQGSALERTAFEAPPRVSYRCVTQEAGASDA